MQALVEVRNFNATAIQQRRADGFLNATAMCQATGKLWADYWRLKSTGEFMEALAANMGIAALELVRSRVGGNHSGTYVHPQVAIHLAQWCSPAFAVQVTAWVFELLTTGTVDITRTREWQRVRGDGKAVRRSLTDTLQAHGVRGIGYAVSTDAINEEVLGVSAAEFRRRHGLARSASTRDHLNADQIAKLIVAERVAAARIEDKSASGNAACTLVCRGAAADAVAALDNLIRPAAERPALADHAEDPRFGSTAGRPGTS